MATLKDTKNRFTEAQEYGIPPSTGGGTGTPGDSVVEETAFGQASAAGSSSDYSRADHTHGTPAAPAAAPSPATTVQAGTSFGLTPAVGTAAKYAREDHQHGTPTSAVSPASTVEAATSFGISPAVGTDAEYARADHQHGTPAEPTAPPGPAATVESGATFGLTPAVGVGTTYARVDHQHGTPASPTTDLTETRLPVMGASALEDSRFLQTDVDAVQVRVRETSGTDWTGLQITSVDEQTSIAGVAVSGGLDTYPSLVLTAGGFSGSGSVSLGVNAGSSTMSAAGLVGTGEVTASAGAIEIVASASVDSLAEINLTTTGDSEPSTQVTLAAGVVTISGRVAFTGGGGIITGTGTPEGAVAAGIGTLFLRTDGSSGETLYVKEGGTGNTGWAAK